MIGNTWIKAGAIALAGAVAASGASASGEAAEQAHAELRKFLDPHGVIRDFVGETPTPEECELGKPNAIGWFVPIEDGPMFTGVYLAAICERARRSGAQADRELAARLAGGLMKCASVSDVPGFIARGVGTDGKSHYPFGSDDQTHPWFLGLFAYLRSGIPDGEEKERIAAKLLEVGDALEQTGWRCPADGAFKGSFRGGYTGKMHRDAVRYVFMLRVLYEVGGGQERLERYRAALAERPRGSKLTRAELCAAGYEADREEFKNLENWAMWIYVGAQYSLAALAALEDDAATAELCRTGLAANAKSAMRSLNEFGRFDNADGQIFEADWRKLNADWFPQKNLTDVNRLGDLNMKKHMRGRAGYEHRYMCQPLAAAAIVAFAPPDAAARRQVEAAIAHYDYAKLKLSRFLYAECARYALPATKP